MNKIIKTVEELIEALAEFPKDTLISVSDSEWGPESINSASLRKIDGQPWAIKGDVEAVVIETTY